MVAFCPNHLQKWSKGEWNTVPSDCLSGFSIDTRKIQRGDVFVAIRSARDGHNYLDSAQLGGAAAALVEEVNPSIDLAQLKVKNTPEAFLEIAHGHRRQFNKPVVGVTGSWWENIDQGSLGYFTKQCLIDGREFEQSPWRSPDIIAVRIRSAHRGNHRGGY